MLYIIIIIIIALYYNYYRSTRLAVGPTRFVRLVLWRVASGAPGGSLLRAVRRHL